jgi:hypothetical protein
MNLAVIIRLRASIVLGAMRTILFSLLKNSVSLRALCFLAVGRCFTAAVAPGHYISSIGVLGFAESLAVVFRVLNVSGRRPLFVTLRILGLEAAVSSVSRKGALGFSPRGFGWFPTAIAVDINNLGIVLARKRRIRWLSI